MKVLKYLQNMKSSGLLVKYLPVSAAFVLVIIIATGVFAVEENSEVNRFDECTTEIESGGDVSGMGLNENDGKSSESDLPGAYPDEDSFLEVMGDEECREGGDETRGELDDDDALFIASDTNMCDPATSLAMMSSTAADGSYAAAVIPENGAPLVAGESAKLKVNFINMGSSKMNALQLSIPNTLEVNRESLEVADDWHYEWLETSNDSTFSQVLSLWTTILDTTPITDNRVVSVSFTATAREDESHQFASAAWQEAGNRGNEQGMLQIAAGYSEPRVNVWVDNAEDLDAVRNNLNWHYVQRTDIDLDFPQQENNSPGNNDNGQGWEPIGTGNKPFVGSYNGNGHALKNLAIYRSQEEYVGLFGHLNYGSVISSVNLDDVKIRGNRYVGALAGQINNSKVLNSSAQGELKAFGAYAGGLIGYANNSLIDGSTVNVNVIGTNRAGGLAGGSLSGSLITGSAALGDVQGDTRLGGLVGYQENSVVENCFASGRVNSEQTGNVMVGGLIGFSEGILGASVLSSYATGSVNAPNGDQVGGLIGRKANGLVEYCYASGNVTGAELVGGLIGYHYSGATIINCYAGGNVAGNRSIGGLVGLNSAKIENSYALGLASGASHTGGLIGVNNNGSFYNSFYLNINSNNQLGIRVSAANLQTMATYIGRGWSILSAEDFDQYDPKEAVWYIEDGRGFPLLWWQLIPPPEDEDQDIPGGDDPGNGDSGQEDGDHSSDQPPGEPDEDDPGSPDSGEGNPPYSVIPVHDSTFYFETLTEGSLYVQQLSLLLKQAEMMELFMVINPAGADKTLPIINLSIIAGGNWEVYGLLLAIYEARLNYFDKAASSMSNAERALFIVDLAAAQAALTFMKALLSGSADDYAYALTALTAAEEAIVAHSKFLCSISLLQLQELLDHLNQLKS